MSAESKKPQILQYSWRGNISNINRIIIIFADLYDFITVGKLCTAVSVIISKSINRHSTQSIDIVVKN